MWKHSAYGDGSFVWKIEMKPKSANNKRLLRRYAILVGSIQCVKLVAASKNVFAVCCLLCHENKFPRKLVRALTRQAVCYFQRFRRNTALNWKLYGHQPLQWSWFPHCIFEWNFWHSLHKAFNAKWTSQTNEAHKNHLWHWNGTFRNEEKNMNKYNEQGKKIALTHRTVQMSNYIVALANDGNYD